MKPISRADEQKLIGAVTDVADLVGDGHSPTEAVVKVARDLELNSHFIARLGHAYNTGAQNSQRERSDNALGKFASFPLVDVQSATEQVFGTDQAAKAAAAVAHDSPFGVDPTVLLERVHLAELRRTPTPQVKVAEAYSDHPGYKRSIGELSASRSHKQVTAAQRSVKLAEDADMDARNYLLSRLGRFGDYFKQSEHYREKLACVEFNAAMQFGRDVVRPLFDFVEARHPYSTEKRADFNNPILQLSEVDYTVGPYRLLQDCIKAADATLAARRKLTATKEAAALVTSADKEASVGLAGSAYGKSSPLLATGGEKSASLLGLMVGGSAMASGLRGATEFAAQSPKDRVAGRVAALDDPAHDEERRRLRTEFMLQDMMSNDDVISSRDPDEVLNAYNELSQLSPRASTRSAVMRPALRRALQGNSDMHEHDQLTGIESTLMKTHPNPAAYEMES